MARTKNTSEPQKKKTSKSTVKDTKKKSSKETISNVVDDFDDVSVDSVEQIEFSRNVEENDESESDNQFDNQDDNDNEEWDDDDVSCEVEKMTIKQRPSVTKSNSFNVVRTEQRSENVVEKQPRSKQQSSRPPRHFNSATHFDYSAYTNLEVPVNELSNGDLLKLLIVRTTHEGQRELCNVLKATLRAMHLEHPFPTMQHANSGFENSSTGNSRRSSYQRNYNNGGRGGYHSTRDF